MVFQSLYIKSKTAEKDIPGATSVRESRSGRDANAPLAKSVGAGTDISSLKKNQELLNVPSGRQNPQPRVKTPTKTPTTKPAQLKKKKKKQGTD